jgi:hypothetical protein
MKEQKKILRGRKHWEEQDDEQLQISFEHIWIKQKEEN